MTENHDTRTAPVHHHHIVSGKAVCTAPADAACRVYPDCGCEWHTPDLHGPAGAHPPVPQAKCIYLDWLNVADYLHDTYVPDGEEEGPLGNDRYPDGPITTTWETDYLTWQYADETRPTEESDDE